MNIGHGIIAKIQQTSFIMDICGPLGPALLFPFPSIKENQSI